MTDGERADVVQMLKSSANEYLSSIDVNDSQWHWKPAPECWSIGQTAEHIVQAEVVIFRRLDAFSSRQRQPGRSCVETRLACGGDRERSGHRVVAGRESTRRPTPGQPAEDRGGLFPPTQNP